MLRKWSVRFLVAGLLGVSTGAAIGLFGVQTLEPGNPGQVDSLDIPDSSDTEENTTARNRTSSRPSAAGATNIPQQQDYDIDTVVSVRSTPAAAAVAVPNLAELEEGDARAVLEDLGFQVGQVMFRGSPKPMGTVLSTFPVAGELVALPATVNLILSNGRGRRDSAELSYPGIP